MHLRSLVSTFVVRSQESIIAKLALGISRKQCHWGMESNFIEVPPRHLNYLKGTTKEHKNIEPTPKDI